MLFRSDFQAAAPGGDVKDSPQPYDPESDGDLYNAIFGNDEDKPFGDEQITEDQAANMK